MIGVEKNARSVIVADDGTIIGDTQLGAYVRATIKSVGGSRGDAHVAAADKITRSKFATVTVVKPIGANRYDMPTYKMKSLVDRLIRLKHGSHDQSSHGRRGGKGGGGGGVASQKPIPSTYAGGGAAAAQAAIDKARAEHKVETEIMPMENDKAVKPERSPRAVELATQYRNQYLASEPRITADMKAIADEAGMPLSGTAFRIKGTDSLARKIDKTVAEEGVTPEAAAAAMNDVIRFTMIAPTDEFVDRVPGVIEGMRAKGYEVDVKNYWQPGDPYQGMNVPMRAPDGSLIEMQFHTPESHAVKEMVHKIYDEYRKETDPDIRRAQWDEMTDMSSVIPQPPGDLLSIGRIKYEPRPTEPSRRQR
jgi:hypothetical protein